MNNPMNASLAERYSTDKEYPVGTVVGCGGSAELMAVSDREPHSVVGVIADKPALGMNDRLNTGVYVTIKGRATVLIATACSKGDALEPSNHHGIARVNNSSTAFRFAVALENSSGQSVEAVLL
jgi:hypothetical protein